MPLNASRSGRFGAKGAQSLQSTLDYKRKRKKVRRQRAGRDGGERESLNPVSETGIYNCSEGLCVSAIGQGEGKKMDGETRCKKCAVWSKSSLFKERGGLKKALRV